MKFKNGLYHKDIYMPKVSLGVKPVKVNYSQHALNAAYNDIYEEIVLQSEYNFSQSETIEIEIYNDKLIKMVSRFDYSTDYNLIVVIIPETKVVKTVWLNEKNDIHKTLDTSKYITG